MNQKLHTILKKSPYWMGIVLFGTILGISLQFTRAWVEPQGPPPTVNVEAPLNTSQFGQTKKAGLILGLHPVVNGLIVQNGNAIIQNGNVGIGTSAPVHKLDVNGEVINNGWYRSRGNTGWYSETYGGGWWMTDATWLRTYGSKSIWTNSGLLGSQGGLTIGYGGAASPSTGAIIAGNVGIGTTSPNSSKGNNGYLTVKDVYIENVAKWGSELTSAPAQSYGAVMYNGFLACGSVVMGTNDITCNSPTIMTVEGKKNMSFWSGNTIPVKSFCLGLFGTSFISQQSAGGAVRGNYSLQGNGMLNSYWYSNPGDDPVLGSVKCQKP